MLYAAAFRCTPPDLGFLPASWRETAAAVDFSNGLLILALVFHGFWCFAYFACLSPSMGVMVELRAPRSRGHHAGRGSRDAGP